MLLRAGGELVRLVGARGVRTTISMSSTEGPRRGGLVVVSHESAFELLGLSEIIPNLIHLSVPRARRTLARRSGVALHTTTRPLDGADMVLRSGMRLTGPARTIADVAEAGLAPEQVVRAAAQAIDRGLTTPSRLREAVMGRGRRVEQLVEIALAGKDT